MAVNSMFLDISIVIIIATLFAYLAKKLKQPLIPAYIFAGILIGPVFGLVTDMTTISTLSELGIALMLFIVGLEMNFDRLRHVAFISTVGGLTRSLILFTFGFLIAMGIGFFRIEAIYIGIILAFSSTMVVVKLLSEKRELDTLHGRIIIGILLMEDIIAIIALSILSTSTISLVGIIISLVKFGILFLIAMLGSKFILPRMFKFAAKHMEILFLLSVSVLLSFTVLSKYLGAMLAYMLKFLPENILVLIRPELSIIIGAFLAGVMLGNLPYYVEIISRVTSLKDFFATIFFVSLGMGLVMSKSIIRPLIIFTLFIIIVKPLITLVLCSYFGYKKRPSFLTAMSLAQISEFSLIIVAQGFLLNHISQSMLSMTVILAILTMSVSTYFINFETKIYNTFSKWLNWLDKIAGDMSQLEYMPKSKKMVILCGYNRIGYSILKTLKGMRKNILVVDFNPEVIKDLINKKVPCLYGDVGDIETTDRLDLKKAEMVISTVPDIHNNLMIIKKTREQNNKAKIFVTTNEIEEALNLYDAGADYVILPHFLGGEHASA
ncbi:MAG: cation:proton antiporter, partial [Nanoarchaeota archaeon]|nr:cation:proton antiporter [Nanoarchaeota archaeon]